MSRQPTPSLPAPLSVAGMFCKKQKLLGQYLALFGSGHRSRRPGRIHGGGDGEGGVSYVYLSSSESVVTSISQMRNKSSKINQHNVPHRILQYTIGTNNRAEVPSASPRAALSNPNPINLNPTTSCSPSSANLRLSSPIPSRSPTAAVTVGARAPPAPSSPRPSPPFPAVRTPTWEVWQGRLLLRVSMRCSLECGRGGTGTE